jgi:hypothetical protein
MEEQETPSPNIYLSPREVRLLASLVMEELVTPTQAGFSASEVGGLLMRLAKHLAETPS